MSSLARRALVRRVYVSFHWDFTGGDGLDCECKISGYVYPPVMARIFSDPDDCHPAEDADFEIEDITGISRDLTDDEFSELLECCLVYRRSIEIADNILEDF